MNTRCQRQIHSLVTYWQTTGVIVVTTPDCFIQVQSLHHFFTAMGDLTDDDAVLVKGSRIARLERLVAVL